LQEDSRLIDMIRNGNTDSFSGIIERYQSPIFRYIYRLSGNYEAALDLRQDTFLRAYKGIMQDEVKVSFKAWLYRIATNNTLQYLRRKRLISFVPLKNVSEKDIAGQKDPAVDIGEKSDIREILGKIPPERRVCMVLHFVEGFKYREIAGTLGISEEAVRKRVVRGSEEFRRLYGGGGEVK
jgi:RNA polymerase sigma-70 factor (ECF subfamily)